MHVEIRKNFNRFFEKLYSCGAWLHPDESGQLAAWGLVALRAQHKLATLSVQMREPRFPLHCKTHMTFHMCRIMSMYSEKRIFCESLLVDGCQICESFVGIVSRYSRRVSPRATIERTLDIYLTSLRNLLIDTRCDDE